MHPVAYTTTPVTRRSDITIGTFGNKAFGNGASLC